MHPFLSLDDLKLSDWVLFAENARRGLGKLRLGSLEIPHLNLLSSLWMADQLHGLLLVSFPCALLATVLYTTYCWRSKDKVLPGTRAALMSLYAFITPTQSFWPPHYLSLAQSAAKRDARTIRLSLGMLYHDLLDDAIELRYPREHLPLLLRHKLSVPSRICLDVEFFWWAKLLWFMFSCYAWSGRPSVTLITRHEGTNAPTSPNSQLTSSPPPPYPRAAQDHTDVAAASSPPSTLFFSMLYENARSVSLDCLPYYALERAIRKLQSKLEPGAYLTIGLTTRAGPAAHTFWDIRTIYTALPFFPRTYLRGRPSGSPGDERRTTTPLFATLPHVLGLLTSGHTPLNIVLVRNVSAEYAVFLRRSAHALEDDWEIRDAFVREWGARAWREERVCTMWEAALVDAGLLAGWAVVVRKPE
ncbi:hypothetical protein C8Q77DRAFT_1093634 [Trametes polyzona]|nr:hypothetical protein C8Q77DRAFT_1093634 [Trametes polyzona]